MSHAERLGLESGVLIFENLRIEAVIILGECINQSGLTHRHSDMECDHEARDTHKMQDNGFMFLFRRGSRLNVRETSVHLMNVVVIIHQVGVNVSLKRRKSWTPGRAGTADK